MAATIIYGIFNEFPLVRDSDKIEMLGVTKLSYIPGNISYVSIIFGESKTNLYAVQRMIQANVISSAMLKHR